MHAKPQMSKKNTRKSNPRPKPENKTTKSPQNRNTYTPETTKKQREAQKKEKRPTPKPNKPKRPIILPQSKAFAISAWRVLEQN